MPASQKLLDRINQTTSSFDVSRSGELIDNPIQIRLQNKPGTTKFTLFLNGKQIKEGAIDVVLAEADRVELLTKEELNKEFGI